MNNSQTMEKNTKAEIDAIKRFAQAEAKLIATKAPIPDAEAAELAKAVKKSAEVGVQLRLDFISAERDGCLYVELTIVKIIPIEKSAQDKEDRRVAELEQSLSLWRKRPGKRIEFQTRKPIAALVGKPIPSREFLKLLGIRTSDLDYSVMMYYLGGAERLANGPFSELKVSFGQLKKIYKILNKSGSQSQKRLGDKNTAKTKRSVNESLDTLYNAVDHFSNGAQIFERFDELKQIYKEQIELAKKKIIALDADWTQKVALAKNLAKSLGAQKNRVSSLQNLFNSYVLSRVEEFEDFLVDGFKAEFRRTAIEKEKKRVALQKEKNRRGTYSKSQKRKEKMRDPSKISLSIDEFTDSKYRKNAKDFGTELSFKIDPETSRLIKNFGDFARRLAVIGTIFDVIKVISSDTLEDAFAYSFEAVGEAVGAFAGAQIGAEALGSVGLVLVGPVGAAIGIIVGGILGGIIGGLLGGIVGEEAARRWAEGVAKATHFAMENFDRAMEEAKEAFEKLSRRDENTGELDFTKLLRRAAGIPLDQALQR